MNFWRFAESLLRWSGQSSTLPTLRRRKSFKKDIMLKYSSSTLIKKEACRSVNVGYLFLKDIYYDLKIHDICAQIAEKYKFEFDLNQILSMLLFSRIIYPGSKRSSLELFKKVSWKAWLQAPSRLPCTGNPCKREWFFPVSTLQEFRNGTEST